MRRFSFLGAVLVVVTGCGGETGPGGGTSGKAAGGNSTGGSSTGAGGTSGAGATATGGKSSAGTTAMGGAAGSSGGSATGCSTDKECPISMAPCVLCGDGTAACPWAKCDNGHCTAGIDTCAHSGTGGGTSSGGAPGAGGTSGGGGTSGNLKWYATCGPPVCRAPSGSGGTSSGAPPCKTTETVGATCATAGTQCDSGGACAGPLMCASTDPKHGGQCPISRAKYKTGIEYLTPSERAKLADDVQSIPLVRYRYKDGPEREHLGFIIEDVEPSPGVDSQHDQVDLYGYTSMAVAALQEQHREIDALRREIDELRAQIHLKAKGGRTK